ncbi:hypothetical protein ACSTH6_00055, partial [Vibrio parahaemolyticus]
GGAGGGGRAGVRQNADQGGVVWEGVRGGCNSISKYNKKKKKKKKPKTKKKKKKMNKKKKKKN